MLKPKKQLSPEETRAHIKRAGLSSLLRTLYFMQSAALAKELGLSEDQVWGLFSSRMDLNEDLKNKLQRLLGKTF